MNTFLILFLVRLSLAQNFNQILNTSSKCSLANSEYKCMASNEVNRNVCSNYNGICPNNWGCSELYKGFLCRPYNTSNFPLQQGPRRRRKSTDSVNSCSKFLCQNGGFCKKGQCICLKHYQGKYCTEQVNNCLENPCKHKTKCITRVGGFNCECTKHLAGKLCQIRVQQAFYNMKRPNFIYEPLQYVGFKYYYVFYAESLGVQPEVEVDFGDGSIIKRKDIPVFLNKAFTTLIKYFPPPLHINSDQLEVYFFTHIYEEPKIHTLKVRAWNKYQEVYNTDYEVRVIKVGRCNLEVALHNAALNGKFLNLFRQNSINIMAAASSNCIHFKLDYQWEIHKVEDFKKTLTKNTLYRIQDNSVEMQNSNLVIPPFTLDYGNYIIALHVEMVKPKRGITRKLVTWLTINQRPILAHIQGGNQIFINTKSMFYLDASMSYDPNYGRNRQPPLIFTWICQPIGKFCKGHRTPLDTNGSILIVPPDSLTTRMYTFTVFVNHSKVATNMAKHAATAKQNVQPVTRTLPVFSIRCLRNCIGGRANNMYMIALKGINIVRLNERARTYTSWLVYPHPVTNQQFVMDLDNTEYSDAKSVIMLYSDQLKSGDDFKFLYTGYVQQNTLNLQPRNVAFADFYLTTYKSPSNGSCSVYPMEGYAMLSSFSITCEGFTDPERMVILYEVVQFIDMEDKANSGALVTYDYSNTMKNISLSPGLRKDDYITTLQITATDHNGVSGYVEIGVIVFPLIYYLKHPKDVLQTFVHVGNGLNSHLNILLSSGNNLELVQQISATCFSLQHFLQSEDILYLDEKEVYSVVEQVRDILISYLYQVPISTLQNIKHIATALDKIMNLPSNTNIWRATTVIGIEILKNLIHKLEDRFNKYDEEVFQNDMDDIGIMFISIASNILKTPTSDWNVLREDDADSENNRLSRRKYIQEINPFNINTETLTNHDSTTAMDVIDRFMRLYMTYKLPNERTTLFTNSKVSLIMKKAAPEYLTMRSLALANTISLEPLFHRNLYNKNAFYNMEIIVMNDNPNWHNKKNVDGLPFPFVKINLTNEVDGSSIDADMVVYMRAIRTQQLQFYKASLPIRLFWQIKEKHIRVHRIIVPKGGKLIIQFLPIQDNYKIRVVVKKEMRPRMVDFWLNGVNIPQRVPTNTRDKGLSVFVDDEATEDNTFFYLGVLPHIDTLKELMKDVEEPILPHAFHYDEESYGEGDMTHYYDAMESTTTINNNIQFIQHRKIVSDTVYNNRTLPYSFAAHSVRCITWNEASKHWKKSCNVRASTSSARVVCNCTGHDPVTVSYHTVPVRFQEHTRTVYYLQYVDNPIIPFVVLFSLILFIGLFKWADAEDRKDRLRRTVCFLVDNYPQCEYCYLVIVYTGNNIKAGTTSNVTIELEGTYATSLPHVLKDWTRDVMERGSQDWFVLKTTKPLGEIYCLHIWTDYSGRQPSWYCNKIVIHDVQEQQVWFFLVNKWFDPINGDGTMSYTIYQSRHEQIFSASYQIQENMVREFQSGMHGWLSIFFKHPYSCFTRQQRVGVAYTHMVLIMMLLILLNVLPVADSPQHQMYATGSYQWEARDLVMGVYALLIAFPIHSILMCWFRCVKPSSQWTDSRLDPDLSRFNINPIGSEDDLWINPAVKYANIQITQRPIPKSKHVSFYTDFYEPEGDHALRSRWSLEKLEKRAGDDKVVPLRAPTSIIETEGYNETPIEVSDAISAIYGQEVVGHSYCCPPCCVFIGWVLVFVISLPCVYITIIYGISYGWVMSLHYLTSFFVAITLSVFVMEPLKLFLTAVCIFLCNRREYSIEDRSDIISALNTEYQVPEYLKNHVIDKINNLRKSPMYMPLVEEVVQKARRNRVSTFLMRIIIADFMLLMLFILFFTTMIYNVFDPSCYLHHEDIMGLFKSPGMTDTVNTEADLVDYLKNTIIANLQYFDNPGRVMKKTDPLNPVMDEVNFLVGVIRLRQIRKSPSACRYKPRWSARCTKKFDHQNYTEGWELLQEEGARVAAMKEPWLYQIPKPIFRGIFMHPNGTESHTGSYQAFLGRTKQDSLMKLEYLSKNHWFDYLTTIVYIDFVLYNLNTHQLTLTTLIAERTVQGVYYINSDIEIVQMQELQAIAQLYVLFFLLVIFIWLVWYIHKESIKYSLLRPNQVFTNKWNKIKKFLLVVGVTNVVIYTKKILEYEYYTEKLSHASSEEYIDFESLPFWDNLLLILIAFMQFLVILEICHLFTTCYRVNLALTVVYKSRVGSFFLYLTLLIISFTWFGYLLFGRLSYDFQNFKAGFFTVLTFATKTFRIGRLGNYDSFFLTFLYYLAIFIGFFFVFRWLIATTMLHSFSAAKRSAHFDPYLPILSNYTKKYFDSIDSSPNRKPFKLSLYLQTIEPRMYALGHLFIHFYFKRKEGRDLREERELAMDGIAFSVIKRKTKYEKVPHTEIQKYERKEQAKALARNIIIINTLKNKLEYIDAKLDIRIRNERYKKMLKLVKKA